MSYYIIVCYVILYHSMLCHIISYQIILYCMIVFHVVLCYIGLCHIRLYHIKLYTWHIFMVTWYEVILLCHETWVELWIPAWFVHFLTMLVGHLVISDSGLRWWEQHGIYMKSVNKYWTYFLFFYSARYLFHHFLALVFSRYMTTGLQKYVDDLSNCIGSSERIVQTPGKTNLSFPILSYPIMSYPILSFPILSDYVLFYPLLSYPIMSYHIHNHVRSYPILSYRIVSYPYSIHIIFFFLPFFTISPSLYIIKFYSSLLYFSSS